MVIPTQTVTWWNPAVEDQATDRAHHIGPMQSGSMVLCDVSQLAECFLELQLVAGQSF